MANTNSSLLTADFTAQAPRAGDISEGLGAVISSGIDTVGDLANTGIQAAINAGSELANGAMTMGIGPILNAAAGMLNAFSNIFSGIVATSQKSTTERTGIIASLIAQLSNADTNKTSNIAFIIMGGVVLILLLMIAMKKQMK